MPKKPKLTKRDSNVLMLGVLLGFILQVAYDIAHELASSETNWFWVFLQFCYIGLAGFLAFLIQRQLE